MYNANAYKLRNGGRSISHIAILSMFSLVLQIGSSQDPSSQFSPQGTKVYCSGEIFRPGCKQEDEVIIIKEAAYGTSTDEKCSSIHQMADCQPNVTVDIKEFIDSLCSGRSKCDISVSDRNLTTLTGCSSSQLRASYMCAKVSGEDECKKSCSHIGVTAVEKAGYISSKSRKDTCGTSACPWVIQVQPGQRINLKLLDFSPWSEKQKEQYKQKFLQETLNGTSHHQGNHSNSSTSSSLSSTIESCKEKYGIIKERANPKNKVICADELYQNRHVYTSISNTIELQLSEKAVSAVYLIQYQAVGCKDIEPPLYSRMSRREDEVLIDCPADGQSWNVSCVDGTWKGLTEVRECKAEVHAFAPLNALQTTQSTAPGVTGDTDLSFSAFFNTLSSLHLHKGILITLVIAIAVIIIVLIVTNGVFFMKKRAIDNQYKLMQQASLYGQPCSEFEFHPDFYGPGACLMPKSCAQTLPCRTHRSADNLTAAEREWTHRPLPSVPRASLRHSGDFTHTYTVPHQNGSGVRNDRFAGENLTSPRYPSDQVVCGHGNHCGYPSIHGYPTVQNFSFNSNYPHGSGSMHHSAGYPRGPSCTGTNPCGAIHASGQIAGPIGPMPQVRAIPLGTAAVMYRDGRAPTPPRLTPLQQQQLQRQQQYQQQRQRQQQQQQQHRQSDDHTYFILDAEAVAAEPLAHLVDPLALPGDYNLQSHQIPVSTTQRNVTPDMTSQEGNEVTLLSPSRCDSSRMSPRAEFSDRENPCEVIPLVQSAESLTEDVLEKSVESSKNGILV